MSPGVCDIPESHPNKWQNSSIKIVSHHHPKDHQTITKGFAAFYNAPHAEIPSRRRVINYQPQLKPRDPDCIGKKTLRPGIDTQPIQERRTGIKHFSSTEIAPKEWHRKEKRHIGPMRTYEGEDSVGTLLGCRTKVYRNGKRVHDARDTEISLDHEICRHKRVSKEEMRNGIGCKIPGDKHFRRPEVTKGYFQSLIDLAPAQEDISPFDPKITKRDKVLMRSVFQRDDIEESTWERKKILETLKNLP